MNIICLSILSLVMFSFANCFLLWFFEPKTAIMIALVFVVVGLILLFDFFLKMAEENIRRMRNFPTDTGTKAPEQ